MSLQPTLKPYSQALGGAANTEPGSAGRLDRRRHHWRMALDARLSVDPRRKLVGLAAFTMMLAGAFGACAANPEFAAPTAEGISNVAGEPVDEEDGSFLLPRCIDMDGDGFGQHCERGPDCDDTDPRIGAECQLTPQPCAEGSAPEACYKVVDLSTTRLTCGVGTRSCVQGLWSHCQVTSHTTLPANLSALITGPATCNPCNPLCHFTEDRPDALDLTPSNSRHVTFDAAAGGVVLSATENDSLGVDTDGDGIPDIFDPFPDDAFRDGHTEEGNKFYVLPYRDALQYDPYDVDLQLTSADIYFLMDTTASMQGEIDNLSAALISGNFIADPAECGVDDRMPHLSKWVARYYPNMDLQGAASFSRTLDEINMDSNEGPPVDNQGAPWPAARPGQNFSIRFSAELTVPAGLEGDFRFVLATDDAKRLFVDGQPVPLVDSNTGNVVENTWGWRGPQEFYGTAHITPGTHDIVVEYNQGGGPWFARVHLEPPSIPGYEGLIGALTCSMPNTRFGLGYFDDIPRRPYGYDGGDDFCFDETHGTPHDLPFAQLRAMTTVATDEERADFASGVAKLSAQCGFDTPESQLPALYAIATGASLPDTANATTVPSERLFATPWGIHQWIEPESPSAPIVDVGAPEPCLPPTSWEAAYYPNMTLSGLPALQRTDASISFNWGGGSPGPEIPNDNFSAFWRGEVTREKAGSCLFRMRIDDGMRVRLNGATVLDSWRDQGPTTYNALVNFREGNNAIEVEYYENRGGAVAQFWVLEPDAAGTTPLEPDFDIGDVGTEVRRFVESTSGAGSSFSGGCGASGASPDHVYQFSLSEAKRVAITTAGSSFQVRLNLLDGGRQHITCSSDEGNFRYLADAPAVVVRDLEAGTYFVVVDGNSAAAAGEYALTIGPAEGNGQDDATHLGDISGKWYELRGNTRNFDDRYSDGPCWGGGSQRARDNVFRFDVSRSSNIVVNAHQDHLNIALRLYDSEFRELYCNNGHSHIGSIFQRLEPGSYYLLVEGGGNSNAEYSFGIGEWPEDQPLWSPAGGACADGTAWGYPCFREGTIPVVMLFTDARMHNAAHDGNATERYDVNAPAINDAVHALRQKGVKVIGIHSGRRANRRCRRDCLERRHWRECNQETYTYCAIVPPGREECRMVERCFQNICYEEEECRWVGGFCPPGQTRTGTRERCHNRSECLEHGPEYCWMDYQSSERDLRELAFATDTVDENDEPLVYQISDTGEGLSGAVVQSISRLSNSSRVSVSLRVRDNLTTPDVDERTFIKNISTIVAPIHPGDPEPLTNTRCLDVHDTWYERCTPGTPIRFNLSLRNDTVVPTSEPQVFTFEVDMIGDSRYVLKTFKVTVIVPPDRSKFPQEGSYWRVIDADEACGDRPLISRLPNWRDLEFEASFEPDTGIRWEAYLADSLEGLETATPYVWESPGQDSPIHLGAALVGRLDQRRRFLKVVAVLKSNESGTNTPTLKSMTVRFTCLDDV